MIILTFIITIGITIFCEFKYWKDEWSCWDVSRMITIPAICIEIIFFMIFLHSLVSLRIIDEKINLYSNQNKEIEQKVETTIKQYMEYENKTFVQLKPENYVNLINLYPELKSDELLQKEIKLYIKNNNEILDLKQEKLNGTIYKWWLYFGK